MELTETQLLQSIWMALRRIEDNLSLPPAPLELPPIPQPDLAGIVTAVTSLKPGPTAEEIAAAIADVLRPDPDATPDGAEALGEVARALEKLDYRLKGMGTQAYGGGSVSLQPGQTISLSQATLDAINISGGGGSSMTIAEEGVNLTARSTLNFVGDAVTAADDAGNSRTNVTVALRLRSPNGTLFELSVANDGTLSAVSV